MPKLTKQFIDACEPNGKEHFYWDETLPGFGLRIFPSGKKSYVLQYRHQGRTRRFAIGLHGKHTPDSARIVAQKLMAEVVSGHDPSAKRRKLHREIRVSQLCDDYLVNGCLNKKASTLASDRGRIERHVKPLIGQLKVSSVTKAVRELQLERWAW